MDTIQQPRSKIGAFDKLRKASEFTIAGVEDSIPLRVLVQIFVFISIGAMDSVASSGNSAWAIPLSAIAGVWAWYARRKRNVIVKLFIAIAMIAMLVVFLRDLVRNADETRLLLARLLIQLQVLHSFDLPRRKDLGYSIVIGLILMALAATLSQTMVFALWLIAFLLLGIPILLLDHRSRLGVPTKSFQPEKMGISLLPLSGLLAIVLVLGLTIFAFLPRLPGFQLRNFPVSVNLSVERDVPRGDILTRQQQNQQQSGNGTSPNGTGGTGNNNDLETLPPLFAPEIDTVSGSQQSKQRQPELVMRVRSQAELFWRVMAYDEFTGKGWRISRNDPTQIRTVRRNPFNYEFFVAQQPHASIGIKKPLQPIASQDVVQTYTITSPNFPNLVPAASVPKQVFFPSEELDIDPEGMIRGPGPLPEDLTYTVISNVVARNVQQLRQLPNEYPSSVRNYYLQVPANLSPDVRNQALSLVANAKAKDGKPIALDNPYDVVVQIAQSVKQNYEIKPLKFDESKGDLVSQFIEQGGGEESHFVSTMAVMLRSLGIPTRYVVGFAPGKFNPFTGLYEVQNIDTQSLVEVYFPVYGWIAFDPIPNRPLFPPSLENNRTFGVMQTFWSWIAQFLPSSVTSFFAALFESIGNFLGGVMNWLIDMGWIGFAFGLAIAFGIGIGGWALWQLAIWWWQRQRLQKMPIPQRTYQQMLQWLSEQGKPKSSYQTPQEYVTSLSDRVSEKQADAIAKITQIYQDWRYGDRGIGYNLATELKMLLKQLKAKI
ncbi:MULTISPECIES: transglutaminase TgpA family protein [Pseudanabaena]|uniref:transglutaminase TgpA family protein n=1 Tax=Pseudanabaena TaxID=1152 RepID=UPI002479C6EC|nr:MULTISPECIES: transglutaminaseTgpA domain-containing protein [Pseudanabaena]MEA5485915.1 transglutaminaseTgpA domain-containing protein [Pseudanabaena sp. CCNP1317]WGS71334.1 transglutaminaseTgpA domain-containing protein [Pseudanabaena galeata CCNP1313]